MRAFVIANRGPRPCDQEDIFEDFFATIEDTIWDFARLWKSNTPDKLSLRRISIQDQQLIRICSLDVSYYSWVVELQEQDANLSIANDGRVPVSYDPHDPSQLEPKNLSI
ncbi:2744_t:CDS:2, partial [Acaulospora colombiana]